MPLLSPAQASQLAKALASLLKQSPPATKTGTSVQLKTATGTVDVPIRPNKQVQSRDIS